jgi:hypothetical protein
VKQISLVKTRRTATSTTMQRLSAKIYREFKVEYMGKDYGKLGKQGRLKQFVNKFGNEVSAFDNSVLFH